MNILDRHHTIAFDFDSTLFGGPHSVFFCNYIKANPQKTYHIVTFRDFTNAQLCTGEIQFYGLDDSHFASVQNVPDIIYTGYSQGDARSVQVFKMWKAWQARELGATLVVDDRSDLVLPGCIHYQVDFLDSMTRKYRIYYERNI